MLTACTDANCIFISAPTSEEESYLLAAAEDVCTTNATYMSFQNCEQPDPFIPSLAHEKIIICSYTTDFVFSPTSIDSIVNTIQAIGAAGFVLTMDRGLDSEPIKEAIFPLSVPGIILTSRQASQVLCYFSHFLSMFKYELNHFMQPYNNSPFSEELFS